MRGSPRAESMFSATIKRADQKLAKIGLHFAFEIRRTKRESWLAGDGKTIYLNPEDRKVAMLAEESELHIVLHECGHILLDKNPSIKENPEALSLFGDLNVPYRRNLSQKRESPDFISHYAQVHPEDNFAEAFAVYANNEGSLKKLRILVRNKHKSKIVMEQFLWLRRFLGNGGHIARA